MSGHYGYMQMPAGPYDPSQIPSMLPSAGQSSYGQSTSGPSTASNIAAGEKRKYDSDGEDDEDDSKGPAGKKEKAGASDFVKKLYSMLEESQFPDTVSWGENGDTFIVKDMNNFTKTILPLHFKHSNFASFVRQLNKYDFHKVKNTSEQQQQDPGQPPTGEQIWEFKHPNFKANMREALEFIRRKAPSKASKAAKAKAGAGGGGSTASPGPSDSTATVGDIAALQSQIDALHRTNQQTIQHLNNLGQDYAALFGELLNFQRNMVAQDQLMQNLIQYLINSEQEHIAKPDKPFVPSAQAQKIIHSYEEAARTSYDQMTGFSRRASISGQSLPQVPLPPPTFGQVPFGAPGQQHHHLQHPRHPSSSGSHQQQRHDGGGQNGYEFGPPRGSPAQHKDSPSTSMASNGGRPQSGTMNNATTSAAAGGALTPMQHPSAGGSGAGPGWAVPPRVLLVEDDVVCRKLSSKFLQLFGCEIDTAVDGISAVSKMNSQKYDLVLMDIMMPNLDGVSATSLIRQFDPNTPIISMTSNSSPNEIMTYFSHGMNDILPKPFTKEGLLDMLEKHLIQFKVVQQMAEIPRALGFTADQIQDALAVSVSEEGGNVMNPFSSLGISDTDYVEMLQGVARQTEGKRALEVVHEPGDNSRARFAFYDS